MKYEIITDKEDLLVLVVNSRIIAVSQDMSRILEILQQNYTDTRSNVKKVYESALIYPEFDVYEDKPAKIDTSKIRVADKVIPPKQKPDDNSLGRLLEF